MSAPVITPTPDLAFSVPPSREANAPSPLGNTPQTTRMLVADRSSGRLQHARLAELPAQLNPGDVVVVNTSKVLPAALPAAASWTDELPGLRVHWSTALPGGSPDASGETVRAVIEVRRAAGATSTPFPDVGSGHELHLPAGGRATVSHRLRTGSRLWVAQLRLPGGRDAYLERHGEPIRYGADTPRFPLRDVQTVFAQHPGSAEPPSAALAFDGRLVADLIDRGIEVLPITLHTGVASLEDHEPPYPEWFEVSTHTARRVRAAKAAGNRIVAVGTTVTRALESSVDGDGLVRPAEGWTGLVIGPRHRPQVVDGLLTGWHEPGASHLAMLEAVADHDLLAASYATAVADGYRWHAFGDLHLIRG